MYSYKSQRYHKLELLTSPSSIFSALIADLQHARESIDMEYYIFANDRTGSLFADILRRKARQGVRVRLIVDGYGSMSVSRAMQHAMAADGVEFSMHTLVSRARQHRKMAIVDGRVAHVGGINIADRYVVGNGLGVWYDAQLRITGEAVAAVARLFDYDYMVSEGAVSEVPMPYSDREVQIVWSESRGGRAMAALFDDVVDGAREHLVFLTPYFMPPERALSRLSGAVARGVRVTVIMPERCDVWLLDHIMRRYIREARDRGIDMRICRRAFVHAKLAIVDGRRVVVGSANLDARSINLNHEVMVATEVRGVVAAARAFAERMLSISSEPTARDMRSLVPAFLCRWFENLL